jgi:hypothetical protein
MHLCDLSTPNSSAFPGLCIPMIVRNPRVAVYYEKNCVGWGPLQTRKDTRRILKPLYNLPSGIQAPEIET